MSETILAKHQQDNTPLHRNTLPVTECDVHDATVAGKPCKAIDVPILSYASIWLRVQREAEAWIAPGGKLIADPVARNRRINQAYAQLWMADHRFQWAGLAAFASKQVGCGLLHAADNIRKSQEEIMANAGRPDMMSSADMAAADAMPAAIGGSSAYMYQQLALGNTTLFLDIYPLHRFFMLRGVEGLNSCLEQRSSIADQIIWPIKKSKLEFGKAHQAIFDAFKLITQGKISASVQKLAYHEQINILQPAIYNDLAMQGALQANQFSWVTDFPSGVAAEIKLTLSAECSSQSKSLNIWFPKNKSAKLYNADQRMRFVYEAADRFDVLLGGTSRDVLTASIADIATIGGKR
ncbi:DUF2515 family protein [Duganella callida]|uniref:Uncharacterized protein n=1 Tax=Duganella callida TaxID=2561932 RepID=A0A4Y9RUZ4_9BURK|nr:hypothetical protein [Duganella callida]TFW11635.1 hypothetical protein E4L98_29460 [Duganella callida]